MILWPNLDDLLKTIIYTPAMFWKYFWQCVIIIDCFEIFMERLMALPPRAQTWSNCEHHNIIKYLIGVTPQGSNGFISKGWGGRTSDIHLTENLENLCHCVEEKLQAFTEGIKHLSAIEVESSRRLSRVRIHVKRVIGMLRQKCTILKSTLSITFLSSKNNFNIVNR